MSKIYLKNNYFNNHSISIHLAETSSQFVIEQDVCGLKSRTVINKSRIGALESASNKYSDQLVLIRKIIESTQFSHSSVVKKSMSSKAA